jgi:iron complex transport system ATP-binding protein
MIVAQNISLIKGCQQILQQINCEIRPGEVLAVIGTNGAGKSSLLRAIAGQESISGQVTLNGTSLPDWPLEELAKQRAVLSQQLHLPFAMPVLEVVKLGRYPYQQTERPAQSMAVARACLQQVGMAAFEQRDLLTLSGGEQQRVHFARVLAQISQAGTAQHRYLLLDEPTASLDLAQQHQLCALLRQLAHKRSLGIFIILHDMNLAARYADRILLLWQGQLLAVGPPAEVLTTPNLQRAFGIAVEIWRHPGCPWPQLLAHPAPLEPRRDFLTLDKFD